MSYPTAPGHGGLQWVGGQMPELGHTQIRDGDEVRGGPEASGSALGLLQQPVHRLHEGAVEKLRRAQAGS